MTEPKKYDPRRTMKLDVSDVVLEQPAEGEDETEGAEIVKGPPPLPPSLPRPAIASAAPPAPRNKVLYGAIFVVMLVVAALGGRKFADVIRGNNATPAPTAAPPEATAPAAPASAPATVTLPPVEIR